MRIRFERLFSFLGLVMIMLTGASAMASEASLVLPNLDVPFQILGNEVRGTTILHAGLVIGVLGIIWGLIEFARIKALPVHGMLQEVASLIYETCKTYLFQQGKLLIILEVFIAACIIYYFGFLQSLEFGRVATILLWSVLGILGSFSVAWFGIRINTYANARTAFASLRGNPYDVMQLPLRSGMAIGVILICVEILLLISILLFVSPEAAGACFIGFAIGESLGAAALRICGGIFTKIADIASDLMKIVFNIKEDDARNPGVIADCVGDNAGDSVGPTADGFETFGVTAVALITFILLAMGTALNPDGTRSLVPELAYIQPTLIVWIFAMSALMIVNSLVAYALNSVVCRSIFGQKQKFNFEIPLTSLVWVSSLVSIAGTFFVTYLLLGNIGGSLWWRLATIISCGTFGAAIIPELTRSFTSSSSRHVREVVDAAKEGGAALVILAGLTAGNFSAFWKGATIALLMLVAVVAAGHPDVIGLIPMTQIENFSSLHAVFALGLLAFGFLSMAPVTIAVDSFGPVTDNAQSVFELSLIEAKPGIKEEIKKEYGFTPDFARGKDLLEEADSAGNTFKATSKPVLIATAVIGATTMIFSIILMLNLKLSLLDPSVILGLIMGGAVVYWFSGASTQSVATGAFRAVQYIKENMKLDSSSDRASVEDSNAVVRICTIFAQKGMANIFAVIFSFTLGFAFVSPVFFTAYLVSIAIFGLFQALFMANAGGAWDNAKKVVEVELKQKNTPLHAATVVGDIVGDPFKDTSSVALNPIIKFTTLFGLLAVEIAVQMKDVSIYVAVFFIAIGLFFVYRSFYGMRIGAQTPTAVTAKAKTAKA